MSDPAPSWRLAGTIVGSLALSARLAVPAHAAEHADLPLPLPTIVAERRLAVPPTVIQSALARVAIWTPGRTLPRADPASGIADPPGQPIRFDIAAGPLETVLIAFRKTAGVTVSVSEPALLTLPSPGVSGVLTPDAALAAILSGTGVTHRLAAPNHFILELRLDAESVDVHAAAARPSSMKFTAPVRDTPQTVVIIPQSVIESQGATSLRDVLRNVPGITYQAGEGGGGLPGDTLSMRGFSATNDIFVDGVRDVGSYSRDAFNLEQVEVVKGPASVYTGRGATGGSINLATKSPHLRESYGAAISGGNEAFKRGTVDVNRPISGSAAARLNVMWSDADVAGRDEVHNSSWGIAPSFAAGLAGRTKLTAAYVHQQQDNVPDYGLPWAAFDADPAVDQSNFYGLRHYDYEEIRSDAATAQLSHDLSNAFSLRTVARYGRTSRDSAITAPRPPNRQLQQRAISNETIASQSALSGGLQTGQIRHTLAAGLEVTRETTRNRNSSQTTNQPQTDLYDPDPTEVPFGPMPDNAGNPSRAITSTVGVYAFDTAHVTDRIQVSGGARLDRSEVDYRLTTLSTGAVTNLGRTDAAVTWNAGAVYKPRPSGSVYVGAGTSFSPSADAASTGPALSDSPTAANNVNLEPEKSRNFEVGTKWDLLGARLSMSAAVFRTEKTNARTRNLTNEPFILSGRQRVDGVELSVTGTVTERWSAFAGYAYMDSRIVASANPVETDNNLALVPKRSFSLWTTYELTRQLGIGGGAQFMDNVFRNAANTLAVPSYWLVNGTASYEVNTHLSLRINGNNLTDRAYVDRVGGGHYIPGPRRTVIVATDIKF
jgi:catecholate siderophore receptor